MYDDLSEAKACVDWAVAQIPVLQKRVIQWRRKLYSVAIDTDSEPGKKLYRIFDIKPIDLFISVEAGAIIHSIRSSLDLLACALAERNGHPASKDTYFPIWRNKDDFRDPKSRVLKKIKQLSQIDQDIVKGLCPYPGGNDLLVALHDLDVTRKHRQLLKMNMSPRGLAFEGEGTITLGDWRDFDEKTVIVSTCASMPDRKMHIGLHITFDKGVWTPSNDLAARLREFARLADSIINTFRRSS